MRTRHRYIALDGPVGVGKSSLAKALAPLLNARLVLEEEMKNPFLEAFYSEMDRYAFQTQMAFLVGRYKQLTGVMQQDLFHDVTLADYVFEKDEIFASLTLSEDEHWLYRQVQPVLARRLPRPDLVVFLQASTDALMQRIARRGVPFEQKITRHYLEQIQEAYNRHYFEFTGGPLLIVNTDSLDLVRSPAAQQDLVREMDLVVSGTRYFVPSGR